VTLTVILVIANLPKFNITDVLAYLRYRLRLLTKRKWGNSLESCMGWGQQ